MTHRNIFIGIARQALFVCLLLYSGWGMGQAAGPSLQESPKQDSSHQSPILYQPTTFPQIHTNMGGRVREFVRTMHQDKKGNFWFGTNGDGIIRYDGHTLETISIPGISPYIRVLEIVEDSAGSIWFGTSDGLIQYDGDTFRTISNGVQWPPTDQEIWGLAFDTKGSLWVGSVGGVRIFDGEQFPPFQLPESKVEQPRHMLSGELVFKIIEDRKGTVWMVTDGHGLFTYRDGKFTQFTTENGLTDNNTADILEDRHGNIRSAPFTEVSAGTMDRPSPTSRRMVPSKA